MDAKQKAKKIFDSFNYKIHTANGHYREQYDLKNCAKECSLIAIDLVLFAISEENDYWEQVKKEIDNIKQ